MQTIFNRSSRILLVSFSPLLLVCLSPARADIFQWEYINPADPSQGKRQSMMIAPDGAGVDAVPGADLYNGLYHRNLTMAYLIGADLTGARAYSTILTNADLSQANLTYGDFGDATLTGADFTNAEVRGANFGKASNSGTGITLSQLYSTASYKAQNLSDISLQANILAGGDFNGQNLSNASFFSASLAGASFSQTNLTNAYFGFTVLTDVDFTGAEVRGAYFGIDSADTSTGIMLAQLYATSSYQSRDLSGINLIANSLDEGDFAGQKLTSATFNDATLTGASFREANLSNASIFGATLAGADLRAANLSNATLSYATLTGANFRAANLTGTNLSVARLTGANFSQANLTNATLELADVTDADFAEADIRGANLTRTRITLAQLYSTANYLAHDLSDIHVDGDFSGANFEMHNLSHSSFGNANLTSANFRNANLANARFAGDYSCDINNSHCFPAVFQLSADLTDADFTGADVRGASFGRRGESDGTGITLDQLYSTASYQAADLSGIDLQFNNLAGGNFSSQNLNYANFSAATLDGANFRNANLTNVSFVVRGGRFCIPGVPSCFLVDTPAALTGADLTAADARGSGLFTLATLFGRSQLVGEGAIVSNVIRRDGHIDGLDLDADGLLVVRDYDGYYIDDELIQSPIPITVDQHVTMGPGGTLRMVFEADDWDSTISFAPGIPVELGGTLELTFAADVSLASQHGRTFDLIDWTGVAPTGAFAVASRYQWNLANLYTTGEVTLTAIPEPGTLALIVIAFAVFFSARANRVKTVPTPMGNSASSRNWNVSRHTVARGPILPRPTLAPEPWLLPLLPLNSVVYESLKAFLNLLLQFFGQLRAIFEGLLEKNLGLRLKSLVQRARKRLLKRVLDNFLDVNRHLNEPAFKGEYCSPNCTMRPAGDQRRFRRFLLVSLPPLLLISPSPAHADIYQWEYTNAADPSQGKRQSTTLAPGGAGVDAAPDADLNGRNLTMAYLIGADLTGAIGYYANLTDADLSQANLTNAVFERAMLTAADFNNAQVRGANLQQTGITLAQLYSTASYQARDLSGVSLRENDLTGGNFAGQNLTNANFEYATLTGADFSGAEVRGAYFSAFSTNGTGLTTSQFYSTASYQAHNLTGIRLSGDLSGWNFAGQNLTAANFSGATFTDADFTGAEVRGAGLHKVWRYLDGFSELFGTGITLSQLYSTASYQAHDLSGVDLSQNSLADGNFANQNLTRVSFAGATLTGADFTNAQIGEAHLSKSYYRAPSYAGLGLFGTGITIDQLYSSANYRAHDLSGIDFGHNSFSGGDFTNQNLRNAFFTGATLTGADFSGAEIQGASFDKAQLGFNRPVLTGSGISLAQLYSTASYQARDLRGVRFSGNDLTGGNFAGQNLTNASFSDATLTDADFTDAEIRGASFDRDYFPNLGWFVGTGITLGQIYSTASYKAKDLSGISVMRNDLAGGNFVGQDFTNASFVEVALTAADFRQANLTNAYFLRPDLTGADLTAADTRGAIGFSNQEHWVATTTNLIWPDGRIDGLDLNASDLLVVRDFDGDSRLWRLLPSIPITVDQHLTMARGGTLRMVFEADAWDSTISFAPGIPVTLGGALELAFADDVNLASQVGRTFDLFDWTGINPTGAFAVSSPYRWDLSNLYTTGEVTLTAIPEPAAIVLLLSIAGQLFPLRRRRAALKPRPLRWAGSGE
jgi:uncharacterized protein YjbI with pentapeptide repeats